MAMTRPRISGRLVSWRVTLAVAMNVTLAIPVNAKAAVSSPRAGATASNSIEIPNPAAAPPSSRTVGRAREAAISAPTNEPTPMAAERNP